MSTLYQTDFSTDFTGSWGPDWTRLQGNSGLNVTSGQATAANGGTGNVMVAGSSSTDFDVTVTVTQTTNTDIIGPMARVVDASNFYYLDIGAFGNTLTFGKRVSGSFNDLVLQSFTYTQGTAYKLRLQVIGTACKGKAWLATDSEPGSWLIDTTDSSISSSGQAGIFAFCPSVAASLFDDFLATDGASGNNYVIDVTGDASTSEVVSFDSSTSVSASASSQDVLSLLWSLALSGSQTAAGNESGDVGLAGSGDATTAEVWSQDFALLQVGLAGAPGQVTLALVFTLSGQATASDSIDFTPQSAAPANITLIAPAGMITLTVPSGDITLIESEANMDLPTGSITSIDDYSPIAVGDTGQPLIAKFWRWNQALTPPTFEPINLADLDIDLIMVDADGNEKICAGTWNKTDAQHGLAEYAWQDADLDTKGTWTLYFRLRNAGKPFHMRKRTLVIEYAPA